jgi:hypothetical protein
MGDTQLPARVRKITHPFTFSKKLYGKTKKNFEIVIARYDENISWCDNYKDFVTIYNKGNDDLPYPSIKLENKGHLADTILTHIINNYDSLADVTFFTHGSFNYRTDQIIKDNKNGEGKCHRYFEDFVSCSPDTLVYIPRRDLPNINDSFGRLNITMGEVYKTLFGAPYMKNFDWAVGKWISVSKEKIRNKPKAFYIKMLEFVLSDYEGQTPTQQIYRDRGIYIERIILQCFRC